MPLDKSKIFDVADDDDFDINLFDEVEREQDAKEELLDEENRLKQLNYALSHDVNRPMRKEKRFSQIDGKYVLSEEARAELIRLEKERQEQIRLQQESFPERCKEFFKKVKKKIISFIDLFKKIVFAPYKLATDIFFRLKWGKLQDYNGDRRKVVDGKINEKIDFSKKTTFKKHRSKQVPIKRISDAVYKFEGEDNKEQNIVDAQIENSIKEKKEITPELKKHIRYLRGLIKKEDKVEKDANKDLSQIQLIWKSVQATKAQVQASSMPYVDNSIMQNQYYNAGMAYNSGYIQPQYNNEFDATSRMAQIYSQYGQNNIGYGAFNQNVLAMNANPQQQLIVNQQINGFDKKNIFIAKMDKNNISNQMMNVLNLCGVELFALKYVSSQELDDNLTLQKIFGLYLFNRCGFIDFDENEVINYIKRQNVNEETFEEALDITVKQEPEFVSQFVKSFMQIVFGLGYVESYKRFALAEMLYALEKEEIEINLMGIKV
ncbi:MAG: hypothetical protein MJ247_03655 [Alphaproteobacteria bacterium]|nr:hypothetical protein [Alphaproteobacteria bacterium]